MWERLLHIDRRIIYLVLFLVVLLPFLLGWQPPPGEINQWTRSLYDYIDSLPEGTPVMISFDYGPSVMPELHPMAVALSRHILKRNLRLIAVTLHVQGALLAQDVLGRVSEELGKQEGTDYANLGFKPGGIAVILGMGESIKRTYPTDMQGNPTAALPVMQGVQNYDDLGLVITISGAGIPATWIAYAHERYKVKVAAGVTSVQATDFYVYLRTRQLIGMLNGIKGAAEYEYLVGKPDQAALGMPGVSAVHLLMVLLVIIGNVAFFASRRARRVLPTE